MVFTRTTDDAMAGLVKQLDQFVAANRKQNLIAVVVFLGDGTKDMQDAAVEFGRKYKITNVTLAIPRPGETQNGYAKLKLNLKAKTTVVITKRSRIVTANYTFGSSNLDDFANETIIAAIQANFPGAADRLARWKGRWNVVFSNGVRQFHEIRNDNTATVQTKTPVWSSQGHVTYNGKSVTITYRDERVERWTPVGNRMVVEHWCPATRIPKTAPVVGIGERVKSPRHVTKTTIQPVRKNNPAR